MGTHSKLFYEKYLILLSSFLFLFCVNNENNIHSNGIQILSQVFSDSVHNKEFYFKDCFLSKKNFILSQNLYIEDSLNILKRTNSQLEYICKILNEKDSIFIKKQIDSSVRRNINELRDYNFKLSNENKFSSNCNVSISLPIFNKTFDKFYIIIGEGSSFGEYLFSKNYNNLWVLKKRISLTME